MNNETENMESWKIEFLECAKDEFDKLDGSQKPQVAKAIQKVSKNPLPDTQGGYGKPLGSKGNNNLTNLLKIKLKKLGLRIVYKLIFEGKIMKIIVISVRADNEVYEIASKRI